MTPGIYILWDHEKRFLASIDEIIYGDEESQHDLGHDIVNMIRDVAVDLLADDDDKRVGRLSIAIVQ